MNLSLEEARLLLRKAQGDKHAAEELSKSPSQVLWIVGFHAQQAIEKSLKAVLAARGIAFPRTHNLSMLVALLAKSGVAVPGAALEYASLTPFGTAFRYDDTSDTLDAVLNVPAAIELVAATFAWAEQELGL
jgi:HEPN domain-containing protein